ncbi:MAG TPA: hypothetical protein VIK41_25560 [Gemmatimonadaceae bacterium]
MLRIWRIRSAASSLRGKRRWRVRAAMVRQVVCRGTQVQPNASLRAGYRRVKRREATLSYVTGAGTVRQQRPSRASPIPDSRFPIPDSR